MERDPVSSAYGRLLDRYGPQGWWPTTARGGVRPRYRPGEADRVPGPRAQWEIVVGAILTQNTAWHNASLALSALIRQRALSLRAMAVMSHQELAHTIRPAGYYNQKARHLLELSSYVVERYGGRIATLLTRPGDDLRAELLDRRGVGPETADCILLYAAGYPFFVIDTYTRRICVRLGWVDEGIPYDRLQDHFASSLPRNRDLFNEYHALLVRHAVDHCRAAPVCDDCCLRSVCRHGSAEPRQRPQSNWRQP